MIRTASIILVCLLLGACQLGQLGWSQLRLLAAREPIDSLLAAPQTDPDLARQLRLALRARAFATARLALPDNDSYRVYADIGRPFVVWNVFAADEFSLNPRTWCYPLVGCLAYRGYPEQAAATAYARELANQGADTWVGGVSAYSTLGWFDDPVLNTMIGWDEARLVGLIIHELAHQRLFVNGDTAFNESYASFVEQRGLHAWFEGDPGQQARLRLDRERERDFLGLIAALREELERVYASDLGPDAMRRAKIVAFDRARERHRQVRDERWAGDPRYDAWFERRLGNAHLVPLALYARWVPAFEALFEQAGRDWPAFHSAAAELGERPADRRLVELQRLAGNA